MLRRKDFNNKWYFERNISTSSDVQYSNWGQKEIYSQEYMENCWSEKILILDEACESEKAERT